MVEVPATTVPTASSFVSTRSETGVTSVVSVSASSPPTGSAVVASTVAVFESAPSVVVVTTIVTAASPPSARIPSRHVTVPPASEHEPCDGVAETKLTPAGSASTTSTPWASDGPSLCTEIV